MLDTWKPFVFAACAIASRSRPSLVSSALSRTPSRNTSARRKRRNTRALSGRSPGPCHFCIVTSSPIAEDNGGCLQQPTTRVRRSGSKSANARAKYVANRRREIVGEAFVRRSACPRRSDAVRLHARQTRRRRCAYRCAPVRRPSELQRSDLRAHVGIRSPFSPVSWAPSCTLAAFPGSACSCCRPAVTHSARPQCLKNEAFAPSAADWRSKSSSRPREEQRKGRRRGRQRLRRGQHVPPIPEDYRESPRRSTSRSNNCQVMRPPGRRCIAKPSANVSLVNDPACDRSQHHFRPPAFAGSRGSISSPRRSVKPTATRCGLRGTAMVLELVQGAVASSSASSDNR